jgi:hypothetical protein
MPRRTHHPLTAPPGIAQCILATTTAIWLHNRATGQPTTRSLIAYD